MKKFRIKDYTKIALFILRDFRKRLIEVRIADINSPWILSDPVTIYDFSQRVRHYTLFYDKENITWFLYYLDQKGKSIRVMTTHGTEYGDDTSNTTDKY